VVVEPSVVAGSVVVVGCMQDVVAAVVAAGDEGVGVAAAVDTSAPSHHAGPFHSDQGQYPLYSGSGYVQVPVLPVRVAG
jgi:hypothetical protein